MTQNTIKAGVLALGLSLGVSLGPSFAPAAFADDTVAVEDRVRTTIEAQLDAFLADDAERAFAFASPGVRAYFRTPDRFMEMVRSSYAAVYRPSRVEFGAFRQVDGQLYQSVSVTGPRGRDWTALYTLREGEDGTLLISSCRVVRAESLAI